MAKIKEYYEVPINGKNMLIQVIRTEKKNERNKNGTLNDDNWYEIIDKIMKTYFNTNNWKYIMNGEDKTTNIKLKI